VVVPSSIEAETRALVEAYGASGDLVTAVDFTAEGTSVQKNDTDWRHNSGAISDACWRHES
jgi:cysteine synthase